MKRCNSYQSLALVALVAAIGGYIGASVSTAYVTGNGYGHQSQRATEQDVYDLDHELRVQDRRNARLQAQQEAEAIHAAAEDVEVELDARDHYRAYRICENRGYTRSRFHACIDSILNTGEYNGT
ncbi:hypothetical protein CL635_00765 [bacterium]|nr:hypothetical protein [bacterium]|tara:strand:+ start:3139 stop:3513 length:375 start_codon:yes stop_codon:yes gene_type:complete